MAQTVIFATYGLLLLILLMINLLYIFQILKFRLPGDASLPILITHLILMGSVLLLTALFSGYLK